MKWLNTKDICPHIILFPLPIGQSKNVETTLMIIITTTITTTIIIIIIIIIIEMIILIIYKLKKSDVVKIVISNDILATNVMGILYILHLFISVKFVDMLSYKQLWFKPFQQF